MVQRVADSILCTNATNALHMVPFSEILKQIFMHLTSLVFLIRARGQSLHKVAPQDRYLSKRDEGDGNTYKREEVEDGCEKDGR